MNYRIYIDALKQSNEDSLTIKYLPFIVKRVGKKYQKHQGIYKFDMLLEVAIEAALKAESRFDPSKGLDFSTYARYDIDGDLNSCTSVLSKHQRALYNKLLSFISSYVETYNIHPSKASILKGLNISEVQYDNLMADLEPVDLVPYMLVNKDTGKEEELGIDEYHGEESIVSMDIMKLLAHLSEEEQMLITMSCIEEQSVYAIMDKVGCNKSEASSKIDKAKAKFRKILEANDIRG